MTTPVANPAVTFTPLLVDPAFVVVDKAAGVVVEPGLGHRRDSLLNGLFAVHGPRLCRLGEKRDWGLLHRLDRQTTGCLLVALDPQAYDSLRDQFESRRVEKCYLAILFGTLARKTGTIDLPLTEVRRGEMKISIPARRAGGRRAISHWKTLAASARATLVEVSIETGRLHQIRAHMAHLGAPVVGDAVYRADLPANTTPPKGRDEPPLLLHAWRMAFDHPHSGRRVQVAAPIPESLRAGAKSLSISWPAALSR